MRRLPCHETRKILWIGEVLPASTGFSMPAQADLRVKRRLMGHVGIGEDERQTVSQHAGGVRNASLTCSYTIWTEGRKFSGRREQDCNSE